MASKAYSETFQSPITCQLCEVDYKIKWKCMDCQLLMCNNCRHRIHSKFKNSIFHSIIDIKEVTSNEINTSLNFRDIKCEEHSIQDCCLFCGTCKKLVCPSCIAQSHKKHDLSEINDEYNVKVKALKESKMEIETDIVKLTSEKDSLEQIKTTETLKYNKVHEEILIREKAMKNAIDKYTKKLTSELNIKWENITTALDEKHTEIRENIQQLNEKHVEVNEIIGTEDIANFFQEADKVKKPGTLQTKNTIYENLPMFVPGEVNQSNFGSFLVSGSAHRKGNGATNNTCPVTKVEVIKIKEFLTELHHVFQIAACENKYLWIATMECLQKVIPEGSNLKVIQTIKTKVYGMAVAPSNDLLLSTGIPVIQQIVGKSETLTNSKYSVAPLHPTVIHVAKSKKVIIAAGTQGDAFSKGRRTVVVLNRKGKQEAIHEFNRHNKPIFTYPAGITSTSNGNIIVIDRQFPDARGRLVIISEEGTIKDIYKGNQNINNTFRPFSPTGMVTTLSDNVVISDIKGESLHILNSAGQFLTQCATTAVGILNQYSLCLNSDQKLYMGCSKSLFDPRLSKLYESDLTGC